MGAIAVSPSRRIDQGPLPKPRKDWTASLSLSSGRPLRANPLARNDDLRTRLRLFKLQRAELSAHHEIVVVEHQSARNAVLVKLEADGVSRCLLVVFRFLACVEIADRDRPARNA